MFQTFLSDDRSLAPFPTAQPRLKGKNRRDLSREQGRRCELGEIQAFVGRISLRHLPK
ncbi:hypothetical protein [Buttiauxella brennerae]|uniref:hypothetical protein n=1 Tax=Buttiauxella brennerae TaxID=82988 RepID=UPI00286F6C4E|nr:hypothetical protein [Buttiauxella brennerae]